MPHDVKAFRILCLAVTVWIMLDFNRPVYAQNEAPIPGIRLHWSPDGNQVAVVFRTEVRLYDAQLTQFASLPLGSLEDQIDVLNVSWNSTATRLAVKVKTKFDQYLQIWETQPIQLLSQLQDYEIRRGPQWSPDGQRFAVEYGPSSVHIYDGDTAALVSEFTARPFTTTQSFAWNPIRNEIVVGIGTSLYFWDVTSNTELAQLDNAFEPGVDIAFSPDGNALATVAVGTDSSYPDLVIWDVDTLQPVQTLVGHTESIYRFAWANNDRLATVSYDRTIRIWDIPTGKTTRIINVGLVHQLEWYPDDEHLYVIDFDNNKTVINVSTGEFVEFELPPTDNVQAQPAGSLTDVEGVISMAWNSDGSILALSGILNSQQGLWFYDAASGTILTGIQNIPLHRNLAWSPDDTLIVGSSSNDIGQTYTVFRVADGSIISQFDIGVRSISVHWSPDSTLIMVGRSESIMLYNALDGSIIREMPIPSHFPGNGGISSTAWDTENARAYGVYAVRDLLVWNSTTAELITAVEFPSTITFPITLNAAGDTLAVEGPDGQVMLVDPFTLDITSTLQAPNDETTRNIVWHEDNIHLAVFGFDHTIRIWNTETSTLVETIIVGELINGPPVWRPGTNELVYSPDSASPVIVEIEIIPVSTDTPPDR